MSQPSSVSIRLICQESLQAERITCGILELTVNATFVCRGLDCLQDGRHAASYGGRDKHRDVYRIGNIIMKLCTLDREKQFHSNMSEAEALRKTQDFEQTQRLLFQGDCVIESRSYHGAAVSCITQTASCLLMSYAGSSLHNLMYRCFRSPYDHSVANFSVSAFLEIDIMCIDGRSLKIAYSDLHTANISTLLDPTRHVPG